ncbi:AAA domain-containing protein [Plantibacter sp. MCCC 1A11337]|uniref:McrB family protein n=1 Tax=Plantibacter sp. MCCC 1A11337 TaxID=2736644 RepID=UPI001582DA54|nr:AAA family ATPase [Plantibacter sp. MCCC 1A11337]NUJ88815.1 AAA domain-containing protein [Plantibacter sp. MCCC 1A11337]
MELALETIRVLRRFKNAVLEGAPGTGKSHVVGQVADMWMEETGRPLIGNGRGAYAITLHPNTTYEEFVEGLRYDDDDDKFRRKDGFLRRVIIEAESNPNSDYVVLIDELNRANVPKVFGDLLLTMEASKRTVWDGSAWVGGMEVTLPYSEQPFSVPSNVYLLGTMNTSDRSIAPLDSALRRRFGFIHVEPMLGDSLRLAVEAADGRDAAMRIGRSVDEFTNLNEALRRCLGPNAMLGHSYLFGVAATIGMVAPMSDPLAGLRAAAAKPNIVGVFWLEARVLDGGSHNQLGLPDVDAAISRQGIVDSFFPMSSDGVRTQSRSPKGIHDKVDIEYDGKTYLENVVRFNSGGPNYKLYLSGKTAAGQKFSSVGATGALDHKVHVFLRRRDDTLELRLLDRNDVAIAALRSVSTAPDGWHEQTSGRGTRSYGVVDLKALASSGGITPSADEDAERMIWRYAILPQLIDTATQVGATELLASVTRDSWLNAAGVSDTADRWVKFDRFLAALSIAVEEEGYGLTRGLSVVDIPVGAAGEFVEDADRSEDDDNGSDDTE